MLARQSTPADTRNRDVEACVLTPSIPVGRCVAALWVAHSACRTCRLFVLLQPWMSIESFQNQNNAFSSGCVLGAAVFLDFFRFIFFERTRPAASMRPPCFNYLSTSNDELGRFCVYDKKASSYWGARTGCHHLVSPFICLSVCLYVCLSVCLSICLCMRLCVCEIFVVFTDCESCTRPISTKPGSVEAGECGLTRGTCLITRRLLMVAIAGLLCISWCVLGAAGFRVVFSFFFSSNAHGLLPV